MCKSCMIDCKEPRGPRDHCGYIEGTIYLVNK